MLEKNSLINLKNFVRKNSDIDLDQYKDSYIERRINSRLNMSRSKDLDDYISHLEKDPEEIRRLLESLTINITEFFRNSETFKALEEQIIPDIIANKANDSRDIIKVWSAGCSSGEETYSLAFLFLDALRRSGKDYKLLVQGTDVDEKSLVEARIGIYSDNDLGAVRREFIGRYIQKDGNNFKIKPEVQKYIKFSYYDLTSDTSKNFVTYDLIVCRNVIIYFKEELKNKLLMMFCQRLRKNGYLVLGRNESLTGVSKKYLQNVNNTERIYKKIQL